MLKKIFVCMALLTSMHSYGQVSATELKQVKEEPTSTTSAVSIEDTPKYLDYSSLELGYLRSGESNGAYVGFTFSSPFKKGKSAFGLDGSFQGQWSSFSFNDESYHNLALNVYLGISCQIKTGEKSAIIPTTGIMGAFCFPLYEGSEFDVTMGWGVGARIKFKGGYLGYMCTIGFEGGTSHNVGIGFDF